MTAQFQHEEEKERLKALTGSAGFRKLLDLFHHNYSKFLLALLIH